MRALRRPHRQPRRHNVAVGFATVSGALCAFVGLSQLEAALPYVLAVAAYRFIYAAVVDLIRGHARTALQDSVHQVSLMVLGIGLVYGLNRALCTEPGIFAFTSSTRALSPVTR